MEGGQQTHWDMGRLGQIRLTKTLTKLTLNIRPTGRQTHRERDRETKGKGETESQRGTEKNRDKGEVQKGGEKEETKIKAKT